LLEKFKGYFNTLRNLFPDVKFDLRVYPKISNPLTALLPELIFLVWKSIENRRGFFEKYARDNGFNYNNPEIWYSQPIGKIMEEKVSTSNPHSQN
jgi:hypothetical protein